jgi:hypothetical protein
MASLNGTDGTMRASSPSPSSRDTCPSSAGSGDGFGY